MSLFSWPRVRMFAPLMLSQMEDEVVEQAQPLVCEQYTRNSPQGKVLLRDCQN